MKTLNTTKSKIIDGSEIIYCKDCTKAKKVWDKRRNTMILICQNHKEAGVEFLVDRKDFCSPNIGAERRADAIN